MMNNFRYPLVLFIAATIFFVICILFKIQHWPTGVLIPGSMMMVQFIAIVWLGVIIFRGKGGVAEIGD